MANGNYFSDMNKVVCPFMNRKELGWGYNLLKEYK